MNTSGRYTGHLINPATYTVRVVNGLIDEGVFAKHSGADFERVLAARHDYESELIDNDSIKIMVDGVFEGETAAVLERYTSADHFGVLNHGRDDLRDRVLRYYNMGLQLHFHTIGDRAAGPRSMHLPMLGKTVPTSTWGSDTHSPTWD